MILLINDFAVASAAYGILKNSSLKEMFFIDSSNPVINAFNYLKESPGGKTFNLKGLRSPKYNRICWKEIIEEAKKHMEIINPDPNVNFAINQKVKSYLFFKFPNQSFTACNDLPNFRNFLLDDPSDDFIISSDPNTEPYYEALKEWGLENLEIRILENVSLDSLALAQHRRCKALIGSSEDWTGVVSTAGYIKIEDLKSLKPFFFKELHASFQQTPLTHSIQYPLEYITFRKQQYDNMVKYNFNHIAYLRDKYGRKDKGF